MIALLFGPPLPPPPAKDELPAVTSDADAKDEPAKPTTPPAAPDDKGTSTVIGEPVNPAATTDVPEPEGKMTNAGTPKAAPTAEAVQRDSSVPPFRPLTRKERWKRPGSPQRFAFEFKLGPYLPEIDNNYHGSGFGPYATIFGRTNSKGETTRQPLPGVMPIVGFEWQIVYFGGPLGVGTQVGFFRDTAYAIFANARPGDTTTRAKADKVTFGFVPLSLLAVYRFELPADFWRIPLVPYAKAGLTYAFWWMKNGAGDIATNKAGHKGRGGVLGWQLNPGLALRMDFIEPSTAKKLDQATGINHFYLFAEFQLTRLRNFGVGNSIDLGDKTYFAGLMMEF